MERSAIFGLALLAAGCAGEGASRPTAEVTDSSGIRVVINPEARPDSDPHWVVAAEPEVEIGVLEGPLEYQLFRVSGGAVLSDGTIVLANSGSHELRWYDAEGRNVRSVGSEGDGPGEFRSVSLAGVFEEDSLLAFDSRQRRTSVFSAGGEFARSLEPGASAETSFPLVDGVLSGGRTVVQRGAVYRFGEVTTGVDRAPAALYVIRPDGEVGAPLGEFPGSEAFVLQEDGIMSVRDLAFGRDIFVSAAGDRIAIGNNDAFSVRVYDGSGTLLHVVRQVHELARVTNEFDTYRQEQLAGIDDDNSRRISGRAFEQMPRHETFPAYGDVRLDRVGDLWVRDYPQPGEEQQAWQVFDQDGMFQARVVVPSGLRILDIGSDYLLGVFQDEFDVERVRLHRLERGSALDDQAAG